MVVKNEDEAINYINQNEKPLSLYVFTFDKKVKQKFTNLTSSGSLVFNETVLFMAVDALPFGGVGHSGLGSYHGKKSFDDFSHDKSVLDHSNNLIVTMLES